jgi:alkanesulfonate monooxygenase SsuD/methylene tetrahydromethanopterin reductase-like flavin-dependent oxidoreductase (luciferase family)
MSHCLRLWRARIETGRDRGIPTPEEAMAHEYTAGQALRVHDGERVLVGTPERVAGQLQSLAARYDADEVMIVTVTHDPGARRRSCELLAEALNLRGE